MGISKEQALDCLRSTDLIGIGMEADAVRRKLHPENVVSYTVVSADPGTLIDGSDKTLEQHLRAHAAGLHTTASMIFGAGESLEQRVEDLFSIRAIQEETRGFTAFSLSSAPAGNAGLETPTAVEYMRTLAVARMVLDNVDNIEANCVAQGLKVTQMALRFGANDAGAIRAEGMKSFTEEDLRRVIRDAGFKPVERDTLYRTMFLNN